MVYGKCVCWMVGALAWAGAGEGLPELRKAAPAVQPEAHPGSSGPAHAFGRGPDLEQGSDFSVAVAGIPVNLPSTVWGPGYLDMNFMIPELEGEDPGVRRGPHAIEDGGFAVAGSARRTLVEALDQPMVLAEYGGAEEDRFGRLLFAGSRPLGEATFTYGLEGTRSGRPWEDLEHSVKLNAAFRLGREDGDRGWNLTLLASRERGDSDWPDPERGPVGDEDELHQGDGLSSRRLLLGFGARREAEGVVDRFQVYAGASALTRWSDYTYFLRDPERGDQLEQGDRRLFLGLELSREWRPRPGLGLEWEHLAGYQARTDRVGAAEVYATVDRARLAPLVQADATLRHQALFGRSTVHLGRGWRAWAGLRLDSQDNGVGGNLPATWNRSGHSATLGSPKLGLAYRPGLDTEFSLSHGLGFRPGNVFRDPRALYRVKGTELGVQTRVLGSWLTGVRLYTLDLESELGLDPSWNSFASTSAARHRGLEWHNLAAGGPWSAEFSLGWNRARFAKAEAGQDHVPGAMSRTGLLAVGWKGSSHAAKLSLKHLGGYALTADETVTAERQESLELNLSRAWKDWTFAVNVSNIFGWQKLNQEWFYRSRLPSETAGVADRHLKPADPQRVRFTLIHRF